MAGPKRSPKYPFIALPKALDRAYQLYNEDGRNFIPVGVATSHWQYAPRSSGGLQTIGALIGFGLLEDQGSGDERRVRVTELARRIILDQRPDSPERASLIREAALKPPIFATLWERWKDSGLPSVSSMRHILVFDHNFNEKAVDDFIKVFADTVEFAELSRADSEGIVRHIGTAVETDTALPITPVKSVTVGVEQAPKRTLEAGMHESTFPLGEGTAVLQWPSTLSPESFEDFEAWVQLTLRRAKRSVVAPGNSVADGDNESKTGD